MPRQKKQIEPMGQKSAELSRLPSPTVARNLERIAWLMDRAIKVPGTKITVGLDALLGLLPIGGDALTGFVQAALVLVVLKHYRVPRSVAARMVGNVLLDVAIGAIPILGDLFDVMFKANTANLKLLDRVLRTDTGEVSSETTRDAARLSGLVHQNTVAARSAGAPWRVLLPIALVFVGTLTLVIIGFISVVRWLF
jgi:Domain of unknown function (DUF4112)